MSIKTGGLWWTGWLVTCIFWCAPFQEEPSQAESSLSQRADPAETQPNAEEPKTEEGDQQREFHLFWIQYYYFFLAQFVLIQYLKKEFFLLLFTSGDWCCMLYIWPSHTWGGVTEVNIFICLHHFLYVWHMSLNFCSVLVIVIPVLCCYCQECFVCKLVKREGGVGGGGGGNTSGMCLVFDTALWS